MGRKSERRGMMSFIGSFFSSFIYYVPAILVVLAVLTAIGIITIPEKAIAGASLDRVASGLRTRRRTSDRRVSNVAQRAGSRTW